MHKNPTVARDFQVSWIDKTDIRQNSQQCFKQSRIGINVDDIYKGKSLIICNELGQGSELNAI